MKEKIMLEKTNQSVHSMYFFFFFRGLSCGGPHTFVMLFGIGAFDHANTCEGKSCVLFCFNVGYLKRLIPFLIVHQLRNYFFINAVRLRCHSMLLLLLVFPFASFNCRTVSISFIFRSSFKRNLWSCFVGIFWLDMYSELILGCLLLMDFILKL